MDTTISWPAHPPQQPSTVTPLPGRKPVTATRKQMKVGTPSRSVDVIPPVKGTATTLKRVKIGEGRTLTAQIKECRSSRAGPKNGQSF